MNVDVSQSLAALRVLAVDCQATAASPGKGHLFEIAWADVNGPNDPEIISTRVALPPGESLPKRVSRLTGIRTSDLAGSPSYQNIATTLQLRLSEWPGSIFIAHLARYEKPWFRDLLQDEFEWICTHNLAQRLIPGLPRKGLRAVAGYLGRPLQDTKGAYDHVDATIYVWRELVGLLGEEGVETLAELWRWLEQPLTRTDERQYALPRETRLALPKTPGVYRMLDRNGRVLYVGKATSLKDRVNSYYRQKRLANDKMELVSQVWDLDVTVTPSAFEAALLETEEIKRLAPPYNHALQNEGRAVTWCAHDDFGAASSTQSTRHAVGPFSSGTMCRHFDDVIAFVNGGSLDWYQGVGPEVLDEALARFRDLYEVDVLQPAQLVRLGAALHPLDRDPPDAGPKVTTVTVGSVVAMLEWTAVSAHRTVTRGEWMRRLCNGAIRWRTTAGEEHLVQLGVSAFETIADYDRVSVAMAELRRLLREGRLLGVTDNAGSEISAEELASEFATF